MNSLVLVLLLITLPRVWPRAVPRDKGENHTCYFHHEAVLDLQERPEVVHFDYLGSRPCKTCIIAKDPFKPDFNKKAEKGSPKAAYFFSCSRQVLPSGCQGHGPGERMWCQCNDESLCNTPLLLGEDCPYKWCGGKEKIKPRKMENSAGEHAVSFAVLTSCLMIFPPA